MTDFILNYGLFENTSFLIIIIMALFILALIVKSRVKDSSSTVYSGNMRNYNKKAKKNPVPKTVKDDFFDDWSIRRLNHSWFFDDKRKHWREGKEVEKEVDEK